MELPEYLHRRRDMIPAQTKKEFEAIDVLEELESLGDELWGEAQPTIRLDDGDVIFANDDPVGTVGLFAPITFEYAEFVSGRFFEPEKVTVRFTLESIVGTKATYRVEIVE